MRTLGTTMGAYNPMSYHNGSVWPHGTAIAVAGLARYGFAEEAQRVALGLLDAAALVGGRLPELFCGFDRAEFAVPVSYPTSCSPQAWAAAAPVLVLRALLGFDPDLPAGRVGFAPVLPERMCPMRIEHLPLGSARHGGGRPGRFADPWLARRRRGGTARVTTGGPLTAQPHPDGVYHGFSTSRLPTSSRGWVAIASTSIPAPNRCTSYMHSSTCGYRGVKSLSAAS